MDSIVATPGRTPAWAAAATLVALLVAGPVPAIEPWTPRAPLLLGVLEPAVASFEDKIYVAGGLIGGSTQDRVQVWDPATDTWSDAAPLPVGLNHAAAAAVGSELFVIGGWTDVGQTPVDLVYAYDPIGNAWTQKTSMPTARGSPAAAVIGDEIYVVGGNPGRQDFAVYDVAQDSWTTLPDMPTGRHHMGAAFVDGLFYAVGGRAIQLPQEVNVDTVEIFDPVAETWSAGPPLPRPRSGIAVAALGRYVLAFGGEGNTAHPDGVFPDADALDTAIGEWAGLADMPVPRHGISAGVLGGNVHIPGGGPVMSFSQTDHHDVYDTRSQLYTNVPLLGPLAVCALVAALTAGVGVRRARRQTLKRKFTTSPSWMT